MMMKKKKKKKKKKKEKNQFEIYDCYMVPWYLKMMTMLFLS